MPRLSPDTLLQRAIDPAVQDRITLADAYSREGEVAEEAIETAKQIQALKGRKLVSLNAEECEAARLAFIFAEQWESSLADSWGTARERQRSLQQARLFREFRIRVWGKTQMEAMMETATAVNVVEYLKTTAPNSEER